MEQPWFIGPGPLFAVKGQPAACQRPAASASEPSPVPVGSVVGWHGLAWTA
jgi:hypothetical protein